MKRLKIIIILFAIALALPLAIVMVRTYQGLEREERAKLRFFAEALFDEMETELADLVYKEESRAVDEYNRYYTPATGQDAGKRVPSPLSREMRPSYILGYFQNNPDGTMQSPSIEEGMLDQLDQTGETARLETANLIFNRKKFSVNDKVRPQPKREVQPQKVAPTKETAFGEKYLSSSRSAAPKNYLGRKKQRVEEITINQAMNVAPKLESAYKEKRSAEEKLDTGRLAKGKDQPQGSAPWAAVQSDTDEMLERQEAETESRWPAERFQVEVAPFQSVFIDADSVFLFRRIMIDGRIFRQGFLLEVSAFFHHLAETHFSTQPMSRFTRLDLSVGRDNGPVVVAGAAVKVERFRQQRTFPAPFDFLDATLVCERVPASTARGILNAVIVILVGVVLMGLFAIYRSARVVVDLSERRQQFVSSVTHELKTPLTNIRMYIEMLEQGIAPSRDREQEYFQILGSESARLSRLINNVLELSRLEKKQRTFEMVAGNFEEVIAEIKALMGAKLQQEGFFLTVTNKARRPFQYDREVMIQILINLMENSLKFGRQSPQKEIALTVHQRTNQTEIALSDTGPGIPQKALKRVFDDFYRVDNDLTRTTGGTGIGLALVKKFIHAMGAEVSAANNRKSGCTITITLPS